jgi:hypothetical protein
MTAMHSILETPGTALASARRPARVDHLLRSCVLYGAAEFSRDLDLALLPNLDRLAAARLAQVVSGRPSENFSRGS